MLDGDEETHVDIVDTHAIVIDMTEPDVVVRHFFILYKKLSTNAEFVGRPVIGSDDAGYRHFHRDAGSTPPFATYDPGVHESVRWYSVENNYGRYLMISVRDLKVIEIKIEFAQKREKAWFFFRNWFA